MYKRLILIRHSYAEDGSFQVSDFERSLTNVGLAFAQKQGNELNKYISGEYCIISSDAKRALQTTEILCKAINNSAAVIYENMLYHDYTTQDFIDIASENGKQNESVIVIGHNPTIANIAYRFCPDFNYSVPPGTIIVINLNISDWNQLEVNSGKLVKVIN